MEETTTAITTVKEEVRLHDWAAQIEVQQASGMTVQRWCAENGINPKTYYYHLRKSCSHLYKTTKYQSPHLCNPTIFPSPAKRKIHTNLETKPYF